MMNENLEALLNAMGGLSELCWIFYNNLLQQGFNSTQALYLSKSLIVAALNTGGASGEQD